MGILILLIGCSDDVDVNDEQPFDVGADTSIDAGDHDAGGDAGLDADTGDGPDVDAGIDAGIDTGLDAGGDTSEPDVGADVDVDPDPVDPVTAEVPVADGAFQIVRDGLFGGAVRALERSPTDSDLVFAGTDGAGLFRSQDGGQTWSPTGLDAGLVDLLALHPDEPETLWARHYASRISLHASAGPREMQLVVSFDGGDTFTDVELPDDFNLRDIAASEDAIWVGGSAIYRSLDSGDNWESTPDSAATSNTWLTAHPTDPDTLWVTHSNGVWRTDDGGATFEEITPNLEGTEFVGTLTASPAFPERLWLRIANGSPMRSDDGGDTWTPLPSTPGQIVHLAAALEDEDAVWAIYGINHQIARTDDGGQSWETSSSPRTIFQGGQPSLSPVDAEEALVFGRTYEVARTTDGGSSWERSVHGISAVWTRSIAVSDDGSRLVVGTDHGDVFVSDDQGATFSHSRAGLDPLPITAVAIDPDDHDVIYVGTGRNNGSGLHRTNFTGALFKSVDGGQTFSGLSGPTSNEYTTEIVDLRLAYNGDVIARRLNNYYHSTNGGLSWDQMISSPAGQITDLRKAPGTDDTGLTGYIRDGTRTPMAVSDDLGATWTAIDEGGDMVSIDRTKLAASSRVDPDMHYAFTYHSSTPIAFAKYTGTTWGAAEVGLSPYPGSLPHLEALAVGKLEVEDQDLVLATGYSRDGDGNGGWSLHVSRNGASTWNATVLPYVGIPTMVVVASDHGDFAVVGLEGGRGLLVTRTGGM